MSIESKFQSDLKKEIEERLPSSIVVKNDSSCIQGIPDLTVFYQDRWATLECKREEKSTHRPNQDYYVNRMNEMSFSSFVYPENREEVLNRLEEHMKKVL